MPELPEVETIKRGLEKRIVGKTIADIDIRNHKSFLGEKKFAVGQKVERIERRAKVVSIRLNNEYNLLFHLKMTGQLIYIDRSDKRFAGGHPDHNWHAKLPNSTTAIIFNFEDGTHLYFNDMRKFGWCKVLSDHDLQKIFKEEYGPEPFDPEFNPEYLMRWALKIPNRNVKQFLTDQEIVAGIGNIYVDELLFNSKIMPTRKVRDISLSEWKMIVQSTKKILELGIKYGGTTDSDYVNADGTKGGMQEHLKVYHRTGLSCAGECGGTVKRMVIGGRGTHYCSECQKK